MSKKDELEAQGFKTYENEDIQVFWNPKLCRHAAKCVIGNGKVFKVGRRPWVDLSQAPKILPMCSYAKKLMIGKEEFKDVM